MGFFLCNKLFLFAFLLLAPSVGPANVSVSEVNKTSFNISWALITRKRSHGKVILYDIKEELLSRGKRSYSSSRTVNTTTTSVVLYDLPLCSRYHVSVRAYTKAGPGPYSQPLVLETSSEYNSTLTVSENYSSQPRAANNGRSMDNVRNWVLNRQIFGWPHILSGHLPTR